MLQNTDGAISASEHITPYGGVGGEISYMSTAPYVNPRKGRCSAKNNTCKAYAKKGSQPPLCAGHSKSEKAD